MIEVNSRRHPSAAPLYRCLLTGNDQARPCEARNSRPVVRSLLRHAGARPNRTPALISTPHASRLSLIKQSRAGSASRRNQLSAHSNSPGGHFIANKSP